MTITNTVSSVTKTGDGTTTAFAFQDGGAGVYCEAASEIRARLITPDGTIYAQTQGTHFTVAGSADAWTVTFITAPPTGYQITIWRETPRTQEVALTAGNRFNPATIMAAFDKLTRITQELTGGPQAVNGAKAGLLYTFSSTTTMTTPTVGTVRFNNAAAGSTTKLAISATTADDIGVASWLATWDDSTSSPTGDLYIQTASESDVSAIFAVTAITNNTTWFEVDATYVAGNTPADGDSLSVLFTHRGNAGSVDALKTGLDDRLVTGTAGAAGNLVMWNVDGDAVDSGAPARRSVTAYGAVADLRTRADGAISSGSTTLVCAGASFVAGDAGKFIAVAGAGGSGAVLRTTIAGVTNGTTVTLSAAASTTVSGARVEYGTDNAAAFQAAIDAVAADKGGAIHVPVGIYGLASTVTIDCPMQLIGEGPFFMNQFSTGTQEYDFGSCLFLFAGTNSDVLRVRLDTSLFGAVADYRHHVKIAELTIWGNRSTSLNPAIQDLNTAGNGIKLDGSRYIHLDNVVAMYCAEDGFKSASYDFGAGAISCNNLNIKNSAFLSNGGSGMDIAGGDSNVHHIQLGFNAGTGITGPIGGSTLSGLLSWNNKGHGGFFSGPRVTLTNSKFYDNELSGLYLNAGFDHCVVSGIVCNDNGVVPGTPGVTTQSGIFLGSGLTGVVLSGIRSGNTGAGTFQKWGISSSAAVTAVTLGDMNLSNNATASTNLFSAVGFSLHSAAQILSGVAHPGFTALGSINLADTHALEDALRVETQMLITTDELNVTTITSNTLACGSHTNVILNTSTTATVNDITAAGGTGRGLPILIIRNATANNVTFVHNAAKLRNISLANVVLGQYQSIMYRYISGTVWQQIG